MPFDGTAQRATGKLAKLDRVIELLAAEDRWCKGSARKLGPDGSLRRCISGAMTEARANDVAPEIGAAIAALTGRHDLTIPDFNDARRTTHAHVLRALGLAREFAERGAFVVPTLRAWRPWHRRVLPFG